MNSVINNRPTYSISNESKCVPNLIRITYKKSLRTISYYSGKKKLFSPYKHSKNIKYLSYHREQYQNKLSICYCKFGLSELVSDMILYGTDIND